MMIWFIDNLTLLKEKVFPSTGKSLSELITKSFMDYTKIYKQ